MVQIRRIRSIQEAAFWDRVKKTDDCWLWTGRHNRDGYGFLGKYDGADDERAHRYAWALVTGETLTNLDVICHSCDIPGCVRNDDIGTYEVGGTIYPRRGHLYKATQPANIADRDEKNRGNWAKGDQSGAYTCPESRRRGSRNGQALISEHDILAICERYMQGENATDIASNLGFVGRSPIFMILRGQSWQHVPRPSYAEIKAARAMVLGPSPNSQPCVDCGTTDRKRIAKGLCDPCYQQRERRAKGIQPALGANHHGAKLADADVLAIRAAKDTITGRELARRYSVSPTTITIIQQRKRWTHL